MCVHMDVCMCVHMCVYMCVCVCMCVYVCMYMDVCMYGHIVHVNIAIASILYGTYAEVAQFNLRRVHS